MADWAKTCLFYLMWQCPVKLTATVAGASLLYWVWGSSTENVSSTQPRGTLNLITEVYLQTIREPMPRTTGFVCFLSNGSVVLFIKSCPWNSDTWQGLVWFPRHPGKYSSRGTMLRRAPRWVCIGMNQAPDSEGDSGQAPYTCLHSPSSWFA